MVLLSKMFRREALEAKFKLYSEAEKIAAEAAAALRLRSSEFFGLLFPNDLALRFPFAVRLSPRPIRMSETRVEPFSWTASVGETGMKENAALKLIQVANRSRSIIPRAAITQRGRLRFYVFTKI